VKDILYSGHFNGFIEAFTNNVKTFTFQVDGTKKACGESNVLLNGLKLDSEWDGTAAHGRGYLDIYGGKEAQWHISCLFDTIPAHGTNSQGEDVVHVLSLVFGPSADESQPGFTISYKQKASPAVLRFGSKYYQPGVINRPGFAKKWRTPSVDFDPEILENVQKNDHPAAFGFIGQGQKSLGTNLKALKDSLASEVNKAVKKFCPKHRGGSEAKFIAVSPDRLLEPAPIPTDETNDQMTATTQAHDSTNTAPNHSAAETRSLTYLETSKPSATSLTISSLPFRSDQKINILKVFGVVVILSSVFARVCLRCRDPRRRAECLARREERRNKNLYRRAAWQHKVRKWFWNFCLKYGLAPSEVLSWDEKRIRVKQQENILDGVMTEDIRALRIALGDVSNITAAEEGRNRFAYESERPERSRSVSTLPGYESEGSQPPNYDDVGCSFEGTTVVDGFQYTPAETEFRSDSSVISTSPRISREGTNSEFDEKFDPISLEMTGPAGSVLRCFLEA